MAQLRLATAIGLLGFALTGAAQETDEAQPERDLTLPPVLAEPGEVRFELPPEDREDALEVVVTGGQTDWRLPDLGSSLREQREAEERAREQRIRVRFVPLYDPETQDPTEDLSQGVDVLRRVGFLRIFEFRFGRRTEE